MTGSAGGFTEGDIRPDELMQEQKRLYENDVRRLMQRSDGFVDVSCPACGDSSGDPALSKYGLRFLECARCGTVYTSPRPTPQILEDYYQRSENYVYWSRHIFPASESVRRLKIFGPRADKILGVMRQLGVEEGVLVDVGAGFGTFLEEVRARADFRSLIAIEPTPDLAESCRHRGLKVVEGTVEQVSLEGKADVVTAFEVLEHLFDPRLFFQVIRGILKPKGLLVLTCPNIQGFDVLLLRESSATVDAEHLNYFNPRSLALLATNAGFDVIEVSTPGELDADIVRKAAMEGRIDLSDQPFLQKVLIDEWEALGQPFQAFLSENRLSSHMSLTCRAPASG